MNNTVEIQGLSPEEVLVKLYNKELNCKKNILEYVEIIKVLKTAEISDEAVQDNYTFVYKSIDKLENIKPNTILHLKNQLKNQLGKLVKEKDPKEINHFIEFFKEAYPPKERRKDFTWVLMDINKITEEQIWTTLTYINRECMKNELRLSEEQKNDIIKIIDKLVKKNNIKYINQMKSLEKLNNILKIKIVEEKNKFKLKR